MNQQDMKRRTKEYAKRIVKLCRALPDSLVGRRIGDQLFRAGTSVGANYRAACRARSKADFISKLAIVLEEADESLYWLEIIMENKQLEARLLGSLAKEWDELGSNFSIQYQYYEADKVLCASINPTIIQFQSEIANLKSEIILYFR